MRTKSPRRLHQSKTLKLGGQLSLLALLAGLGAGCSSVGPFSGPTFTGSTPNQKQIIAGAPGAAAQPAGYGAYGGPGAGVQSNDLAPPAGAAVPAYSSAPAPYTPPKPYAASGLPTPIGQTSGAPAAPRAANPPGQTLAQLGTPPSSLGDQAAAISGPPAADGAYTVQSGDTMYSIARRNGVPVNQLIAANNGSTVAKLGQKVIIPGGGSAAPAPTPAATPEPRIQLASVDAQSTPAAAEMQAEPPAAPLAVAPAQDIIPQPEAASAPPAAAPAAAPAPAAAAPAGFRWPVRGRVISGFGKKPDGERNDGINLAVPEGTAVKAAEDGTVIYSGNELKSYGNLILVRHEGGWVSAYAHNSELQVKRGDTVRRGQIVATSGMSGGVTTPQVHFELRKDATPVDPLQHLSEG